MTKESSLAKQLAEELNRLESLRNKPDWKFYITTGIAIISYLVGGLWMFANLNSDVEKLEVRIEYITEEIKEIKQHVSHIRMNTAKAETRLTKGVI